VDCYIYRCSRKPDLYLYLAEKDDFSRVPVDILKSLGKVELAMELALSPERKLAREQATRIMENLTEHGFHLQLPDATPVEELMAKIARNKLC
jgi:uncharacterized protein YcgL (UPF0745 family)